MTATYISGSRPQGTDPVFTLTLNPEPWTKRALCAETGGDDHFPEGKGKQYDNAKKVCLACDVQAQCLEYALRNREDIGVWGATSPQERRAMRKAAKR